MFFVVVFVCLFVCFLPAHHFSFVVVIKCLHFVVGVNCDTFFVHLRLGSKVVFVLYCIKKKKN